MTDNLMVYEQSKSGASPTHIESYAYLVKRIAHHMMARMPASVQVEDLIQAGMIGLLEAAQKYDGSKGASFETYAGIRIRGSIVDEMRRGDWAPRSVHRNSRRVSEAINQVEARTGSDARDFEVAEQMGVELEEYYSIVRDCASTRLFSYDETFEDEEGSYTIEASDIGGISPADTVGHASMQSALVQAIEGLPEREKMVLSLYYDQELNLKEIGQVLEVSESRVSQIHSQAAARLKARLKDWML